MGCCSVRKERGGLLLFPLVLLIFTAIAGAAVWAVLKIISLFSERFSGRKKVFIEIYREITGGLARRLLEEPFLFSAGIKTRLSGRIMRFSPVLAGRVYRYFNVILAVVLIFPGVLIFRLLTDL